MQPYYEELSSAEQGLTFDSLNFYSKQTSRYPERADMYTKGGEYNNFGYFMSDQCPWHLRLFHKGVTKTFSGCLPAQIDEFLAYMGDNATKVSVAHRVGKFNRFPALAVKEGIVNALIHFDATKGTYIDIEVLDETMTIRSPGGFIKEHESKNLTSSSPRNPKLAKLMVNIRYASLKGNGMKVMYNAYRPSGVVPVVSLADESFTTTFPALDSRMTNADYASREILRYLFLNNSATVPELSKNLLLTIHATTMLTEKLYDKDAVFKFNIGANKRFFLSNRDRIAEEYDFPSDSGEEEPLSEV